jgi:hypothetical protein
LLAISTLLGWLLMVCHPHFICTLTADTLPSQRVRLAVEIIQRYRLAQIDIDLEGLARAAKAPRKGASHPPIGALTRRQNIGVS